MPMTVHDYKELSKEWHPENAGKPWQFTYGSNAKVAWLCSACGHLWSASIKNRTCRKSGCPRCAKAAKSLPRGPHSRGDLAKRAAAFIAKATAVHSGKYSYDNATYIGGQTKIEIACPVHGQFFQAPADHARGRGCELCQRVERDEFIVRAVARHGSRYDYSRMNYKGMTIKVEMVCLVHGSFWQKPISHLTHGCNGCRQSLGEARIRAWLESNGVPFSYQHRFDDPSISRCSFDFVLLFDPLIAIEYHGEQHYRPVSFGGSKPAEECLAGVQARDRRKADYCQSNGIRLIVVPHWDYDSIESTLMGLCGRHHDQRTARGE